MGFGSAADMTRTVYDPDEDGLIALAQLVAAVCSETEADAKVAAIPSDPIPATPGLRTLGAGAQQSAAGDHAHTLSEDIKNTAHTALTGSASGTRYWHSTDITTGADQDYATLNQIYAASSIAVGVAAAYFNCLYDNRCKMQLIMGGVMVGESGYITDIDTFKMYRVIATRALSGSQDCICRVHNYHGETENIRCPCWNSGDKVAAMVAAGSIKVA